VVVYIDHEVLIYLVIAPASDAKSSNPSDEPSIASLDRPGGASFPAHCDLRAQHTGNATNGSIGVGVGGNLSAAGTVAKRNAIAALQFSQVAGSQK